MDRESFEHSNIPESEPDREIERPFQAILVLGGGMINTHREKTHGTTLNLRSKMRALAAAEAFMSGQSNKIIISGGKTAGSHKPSEAALMQNYIQKRYPTINKESFILEEQSEDTVSNADEVVKVLNAHGLNGRVLLITSESHLERAAQVFADRGISLQSLSAEHLIGNRSQHHKDLAEKNSKNPSIKLKFKLKLGKISEKFLSLIFVIDRQGKVPKLLKKLSK